MPMKDDVTLKKYEYINMLEKDIKILVVCIIQKKTETFAFVEEYKKTIIDEEINVDKSQTLYIQEDAKETATDNEF